MQSTTSSLDTQCRSDFPVLERRVRDDKALVYLDNAATTQKPIQVIDAITDYYKNHNSNIHRAVHALAEESTEAFEVTRDKVAKFLNVTNSKEIIFVKGTTEAINLAAKAVTKVWMVLVRKPILSMTPVGYSSFLPTIETRLLVKDYADPPEVSIC